MTAHVQRQCDGGDPEGDYLQGPLNYEVAHIWANRSERYKPMPRVKTVAAFEHWRNRLGALLILPKSVNASFRDDPYDQTVAEDILASRILLPKFQRDFVWTRRRALYWEPDGDPKSIWNIVYDLAANEFLHRDTLDEPPPAQLPLRFMLNPADSSRGWRSLRTETRRSGRSWFWRTTLGGRYQNWNLNQMAADHAAVNNFISGNAGEIDIPVSVPGSDIWRRSRFSVENAVSKMTALLLASATPLDIRTGALLDTGKARSWANARRLPPGFHRRARRGANPQTPGQLSSIRGSVRGRDPQLLPGVPAHPLRNSPPPRAGPRRTRPACPGRLCLWRCPR